MIHGKRYGIYKDGGIGFSDNPTKIQLKDLRFRINQRFIYEYSFYAHWVHEIRFEKVLPFRTRNHIQYVLGAIDLRPLRIVEDLIDFLNLRQDFLYWYFNGRLCEIFEEGKIEEHVEGLHAKLQKDMVTYQVSEYLSQQPNCPSCGKGYSQKEKSKRFGFVNNYDKKPKRRLFEMLQSQGSQYNQDITFLYDGGDTVRNLQRFMSPNAEHILDWFHVTMLLELSPLFWWSLS